MMYGHGNELALCDRKIIADFSTNIASGVVAPKLVRFLMQELSCIKNYPEPEARSLIKNIANHHNVSDENIIVSNGSNEAFYLVARSFYRKHSLIPIPSFAEYEDACNVNKHILSFCDNNTELNDYGRFDMVWIGNPNNPDGKTLPIDRIDELCKKFANTCFVVDEAYADLCVGFESCVGLTHKYSNLIVIRSMTKLFSIPGIRLGYIVANKSMIQNIKKYVIPWSVNALAIKAGNYILKEYANLLPDVNTILDNSLKLQTKLNGLSFLEVTQSKCNFFLIKLLKGNSLELKEFLIREKALLIRDASNFKGLDNSWIRVASQKASYNNFLYESLKEWSQL